MDNLPKFALPLKKVRELLLFKDYFREFYQRQSDKVKRKILWTFRLIETLDRIPEIYLKHLEGTNGLYEIRVQYGSNIFRIFCFFDDHKIIVIGHGFEKKTGKTPQSEIERAEKIKKGIP